MVFNYSFYHEYLEHALPTKGELRGIRSRLAKYLECRTAHVTQVIQRRNHLSMEMAYKTAEFLKLTSEEEHFFLLLVSKDRAGNYKLEKYYQGQIDNIIKMRSEVSKRLNVDDKIRDKHIAHYYSSWHYSAIHILCSLPEVKSLDHIYNKIKLPMVKIREAINFLIEAKIVENYGDGLQTTGRRIHLDAKSKMISKHHTNWRVKAIDELGLSNENSIHFSAIYSFARSDWESIKEIFLKSLKSTEDIVKESEQDMVGAICLDLFEIGFD